MLDTKTAELDEKGALLASQEATLQAQQATLQDQEATLQAQRQTLSDQQAKLDEQTETLSQQQAALLQKQNELTEALTDLEDKQGLLDDQNLTLEEQKQIILAAQTALLQKEDELSVAKADLEAKQNELANATILLGQQQEAMSTQQKKLDDLVGVRTKIIRELGDALSGLVESFSFTSLAEHILSAEGGSAVQTLSDAGRAVLVRRALEELQDNVHYYYRHRRSAAFCQMAAETIDELKSAGLSGRQLYELAQDCGTDSAKLSELALIFQGYETLLAGTGIRSRGSALYSG